MGMFDTIKLENPLPDPAWGSFTWQTKSLINALEDFRIDKDGQLWHTPCTYHHVEQQDRPDQKFPWAGSMRVERHAECRYNFTGQIDCLAVEPEEWVEVRMLLVDGKVIHCMLLDHKKMGDVDAG